MLRFVALLRGINVDKSTRIAMSDLKALDMHTTSRNWRAVVRLAELA